MKKKSILRNDRRRTVSGSAGFGRLISIFAAFFAAGVMNFTAMAQVITPSTLNFGAAGGTQTVTVTLGGSAVTWTVVRVSNTDSWVTASPAVGMGNGSFNVTCTDNTSLTQQREAALMFSYISGGKVTNMFITVRQTYAVISVSPTAIGFPAAGGAQTVTVYTDGINFGWGVRDIPSWLTVSPTQGGRNGSFTVTAAANTTTSHRTATLTVDFSNNTSKTVTVTQDAPVAVTGVTVLPATLSLVAGQTSPLTATVAPSNATNKAVTWSSSNPSVATVNASGVVTAVAAGTTSITATSVADPTKKDACAVTVTLPPENQAPVPGNNGVVTVGTVTQNSIAVSWEKATDDGPQSDLYYVIAIQPEGGLWAEGNSGLDKSSTTITSLQANTNYKIRITVVDNRGFSPCKSAQYPDITVRTLAATIAVTGVTVSPATLSLTAGQTSPLTATVAPDNATNKVVTWSSSNTSVATVNNSGVVTAVAAGTATITVTSIAYPTKKDVCAVTVTAAQTTLVLSPSQYGITEEGGTRTVSVNANVNWTASSQAAWLTVSPASGSSGTSTVTVSFTANTGAQRTGTVTFSGGGETRTLTVSQAAATVAVTGITVSRTTLTLEAGQSSTLTATVSPSNATNNAFTWSSGNTTVATVDQNGLVRAIAAGTATVTARTTDGGFTATCTVTVTPAPPTTVSVTGVSVSRTSLTLEEGQSDYLAATVYPSNATNQSLTWSSDNPSIATVDQNGLVRGLTQGATTVTVRTTDGGFTADCTVTVTPAPPTTVSVTGVTVNRTSLTLEEGQSDYLSATVYPSNATNQSLTWSSSNPSVATVDQSGLVLAIAAGTATLTASTTDGGFTATCTVTVTPATPTTVSVTGVTVNPSTLTLVAGQSDYLSATVYPSNATNQFLTWSSSNPSVATVDQSGLVLAIAAGTAILTASTTDGSWADYCTVTVTSTTGNASVDASTRIYASGSTLHLTLPAPETVRIYNLRGVLVRTVAAPAGKTTLPLANGIYIVRTNTQTAKILIE